MGKDRAGGKGRTSLGTERRGSAGQAEPNQQQEEGQGGSGVIFWGPTGPASGTSSARGEPGCCGVVLAGPRTAPEGGSEGGCPLIPVRKKAGDLGGDELLQRQKGEHAETRLRDPRGSCAGTSALASLCPVAPPVAAGCKQHPPPPSWRVPGRMSLP